MERKEKHGEDKIPCSDSDAAVLFTFTMTCGTTGESTFKVFPGTGEWAAPGCDPRRRRDASFPVSFKGDGLLEAEALAVYSLF